MYSVYFKKTERSDIHSASGGSIDNRHSSFPEVSYKVLSPWDTFMAAASRLPTGKMLPIWRQN
jgi:hypothetical protein